MNESEEVGDKADERWWVVNAEQYSFLCVGIFGVCILYVMEAHRQTVYLKTAYLFPCMTFRYYKRIFAREEGVKKKKEKCTSDNITSLAFLSVSSCPTKKNLGTHRIFL